MRLGLAFVTVLLLAACGGGGCSQCDGSSSIGARPPTLVEQAIGMDYVANVISADALLNPIVVKPSDIDLTVDRKEFLRQVFYAVVTGVTDQQKIESWVKFLQNRVAHPRNVTMHPEGVMLTDPVWILIHRLGQCGQTNRVLVDGLTAVGYKARTVHLAAHIAAEVWYAGEWHFVDADWLGKGQFIREPDNSLPSTAEIYAHPEWLSQVDQNLEFRDYPVDIGMSEHKKYTDMFTHVDLGNGIPTPFFLTKTATPEQEKDLTFGWNYYKVETQ